MPNVRNALSSRRSSLLAAALVLALNSAYSASDATSSPPRSQNIVPVTKCEDDLSQGTLRYAMANAPDGATLDLSALTCSTITLDGAAIPVLQNYIHLHGPIDHELTIDAAFASRVLVHVGIGALEISHLSLANGHNSDEASPSGGCVFSHSNVVLISSRVTNCSVSVLSVPAYGGGVATNGDMTLYDSTLESNYAAAAYPFDAFGGGASVEGNLRAFNSTIDSNLAERGGGIWLSGTATIVASTISKNSALDFAGGLEVFGVYGQGSTITNSTISENSSYFEYGGIWTETNLTIANSTIAFNHAYDSGYDSYVGIHAVGVEITMESSIVANNTGRDGAPSDLGGISGAALTAASAKNLITSSNMLLPGDTIQRCARLQPLAENGGRTPTHALSIDSAAIDKGDDGGLISDQRGAPRVVNGVADIGSVERQSGEIDERILANGFDELCYQ